MGISRFLGLRHGATLLTAAVCATFSCQERHAPAEALPVAPLTDVTVAAGIDFLHTHGGSGRYYFAETYGSGAAFLDADGDGFQDLYVVNGAALPGLDAEEPATNAFFRNRQDGTFSDETDAAGVGDTGYGMGACAGDYDNDGDTDLYVTNMGANVMYRNHGGALFTDVTLQSGTGDRRFSTSAAFADVDNDGDLDLYVANNVRDPVADHQTCRRGDHPVYCAPTEYDGESGALYRNDGSHFTDVTREAGVFDDSGRQLGVVFGDVDGDGDVDLYVANDMTANFLFRNDGTGHFVEQGLISGVALSDGARPEAGMGTDFGDYDLDGDPDLVVCNFQWESCRLYRNESGVMFTDVTASAGLSEPTLRTLTFGTLFFDYDNDGDLDLHLTNGHVHPEVNRFDGAATYAQEDQLFRNDDARFTEVPMSGAGSRQKRVGRGSAVADYDNDGDLDLFASNSGQRAQLFRNDQSSANHWLSVRTIGTRSNRDGIGARIRVTSGARTQVREVRAGSSYLSQSDLRAHFGLGTQSRVDRVEIRWPSGATQTLEDLPVDQVLVAREPAP